MLFLDTAHHHAQMPRFDDHADALRFNRVLDRFRNLRGQSLLNLQAPRKDFDQAFCDLVPSVSQSEMDHYASIRQRFSVTESTAADGTILSNLTLQDEIKTGSNMRSNTGKGRAIE